MSTEAECYAAAVIGILGGDFPDLLTPSVADVAAGSITNYAQAGGHLEFIVDDPIHAAWRLVPARENRRRVRLAYWRQRVPDATRERLNRLNAALDALPVPGTEDEEG